VLTSWMRSSDSRSNGSSNAICGLLGTGGGVDMRGRRMRRYGEGVAV
jgi:hypothetical protein